MKYTKLFDESNRIYDKACKGKEERCSRVLWDDKNKQYFRFKELSCFIDENDASVLDVGCGNGELINYLNSMGFTGKYTGVDINNNLLSEARQSYPGIEFKELNILSEDIRPHDYVVMSGLFNANFGQGEHFIRSFVSKMFTICKKKTIFNAITTYVNFKEKSMYYIDPTKLLDFIVKNVSPQVEIRHGFLPFNYTVCISKGKSWSSLKSVTSARR